jgi:hypothetical protein
MTVADRHANRERRKKERDLKTADAVLRAMQVEGVALYVTHLPNTSLWQLSNGTQVPEAVARVVVELPNVIGVGDCLIDDRNASQTFRFVETEKEEEPAR